MARRKFLRTSIVAAMSIPGLISFSGCGGGGGDSTTTPSTSLSSTDEQVVAISNAQALNTSTHDDLAVTSSELLLGASASAAPSLTGLMRSGSLTNEQPTYPLFANYATNNTPANPADNYFQLSDWNDKLANHNLAYMQATAQITKLKASLRLYGYKQSTTVPTDITQTGTLQAPAKSVTSDALLAVFNKAITDFKNADFGAVSLDGLSLAISAVLVVLETLKGTTSGYYYSTLAFNAIEDILKWIQAKSLSSINFSTDTSIMLSISKMAVATISVLGIVGLEKLKAPVNAAPSRASALTVDEEAELTAFLEGTKLQSQLVLTLTSFVDSVMQNIVDSTQSRADSLIAELNDPNTGAFDPSNDPLITSLKQQSFMLAAVGLVMKVLVDFYNSGLSTETNTAQLEGDAQNYAQLFTNPISAYDTIFTGFTSENFFTLFSNESFSALFSNENSSNTSWTSFLGLNISNPDLEITTPAGAEEATANAEANIFETASIIATPGLDLATQAANFTTNMSEMAYNFSMQGMQYGYNFAMQGMEYGYLFASRGEEVGLMADRILWMAVQIGQMADRIGEMADRIVYTEQLIVYTEMLILDFGLLIYGGMKQITNLMLMGMAIVFDREWYTPSQGNDQIVTAISSMTTTMLADMQTYQLAVLANQNTLRQTTLGALDWIQGEY
jgi:hypothetical protein